LQLGIDEMIDVMRRARPVMDKIDETLSEPVDLRCFICDGLIGKDGRVLRLVNFEDQPVAHFDCVAKRYENWVRRNSFAAFPEPIDHNPWRASLPPEYVEQKEKERREQWEKEHSMGICPKCHKIVLDTEPHGVRGWRNEQTTMHLKCLGRQLYLDSFLQDAEKAQDK
jgi:hypothetical protein